MTETAPEITASRLLLGLRAATVLITFGQLFGLSLPMLVENAGLYRPLAAEIAAFVILVVVAGVAGVSIRRPLGRLRWMLLVPVLVATVMALAAVPPEHLVSQAEWSYSLVGWIGLLLLMEDGVAAVTAFLVVHQVINFGQLIAVGQADRAAAVGMAAAGVNVLGYQLAVAFATVLLRRIAANAARTALREEKLRTAEAVAENLHRDRQRRYSEVDADTVRLLAGLATGSLEPEDEDVRLSCAVAAARMRRLFAENDEAPDPLLHELRACVDMAERKGVAIHLATLGNVPAPPMPVRRALTEPVLTTLMAARSQARVTLFGAEDKVTMSVVADTPPQAGTEQRSGDVTVTSLADEERTWVEATWHTTN